MKHWTSQHGQFSQLKDSIFPRHIRVEEAASLFFLSGPDLLHIGTLWFRTPRPSSSFHSFAKEPHPSPRHPPTCPSDAALQIVTILRQSHPLPSRESPF